MEFQLTLPERGATMRALYIPTAMWFQLTLPERGATVRIRSVHRAT